MKVMANVIATPFKNTADAVKELIFRTYFSNTYCMSIWMISAKMQKSAQVAHNDCFRACFKIRGAHSITELFKKHKICNFNDMRKRSIQSLQSRIQCNDNDIVSAIYNCTLYFDSDLYKSWISVFRET